MTIILPTVSLNPIGRFTYHHVLLFKMSLYNYYPYLRFSQPCRSVYISPCSIIQDVSILLVSVPPFLSTL